ncbi:MAG: ribbon-helix-helix protein, CopG family [Candidatus Omnitrophica bacterium]|nr:ribbon-helix-helix protein, CopG family [Candidatus Omnitrophota bacterium]
MAFAKVAITMDEKLLQKIDRMVKKHVFPNRSKAIQCAVEEKMMSLDKSRLAEECSRLDPKFEQTLADEGISSESEEWPEY